MEVGRMISKFRYRQRWLIIGILGLLVLVASLAGCSSASTITSLAGQAIFSANQGIRQAMMFAYQSSIKSSKESDQAVLPNSGLTGSEKSVVFDGTSTESGPTTASARESPQGEQSSAGDQAVGKALFMGDIHLKHGAPFCLGCHSINDTGILGGGTFGPNLTNAYAKYGDAGLEAVLTDLPFLAMHSVYANNAITPQQKVDLLAFLKSVNGTPETNKEPIVIAISLAGFLFLMLVFVIAWRNRLRTVRKELVERSRGKG
jgi:mono/diheme cytochrome c family protein